MTSPAWCKGGTTCSWRNLAGTLGQAHSNREFFSPAPDFSRRPQPAPFTSSTLLFSLHSRISSVLCLQPHFYSPCPTLRTGDTTLLHPHPTTSLSRLPHDEPYVLSAPHLALPPLLPLLIYTRSLLHLDPSVFLPQPLFLFTHPTLSVLYTDLLASQTPLFVPPPHRQAPPRRERGARHP